MGSDADWDAYIGERWLELCGLMLDRHLAFRRRHGEDRFFDVGFDALTSDTMAEVERLYDWLGWDVTDTAEAAMRAYLDEAPAGRFGTHTYELSRFGLTADQIRDRVAPYLDRFDLVS
jgi:hypothetical protein